MSSANKLESCPVCGEGQIRSSRMVDGWALLIECERCGKYKIDHVLVSDKNPPWSEVRHLVSAWVRRENNANRTPTVGENVDVKYLYSPAWADQFKHMGFPESINEKLDALLLAYVDSAKGDFLQRIDSNQPSFTAKVAAKDAKEVRGLARLLEEIGYLEKDEKSYGGRLISPGGWLRAEELQRITFTKNSAFIAMWFSDITKLYRKAVIAAVEYCGYKPIWEPTSVLGSVLSLW